MNCTACGQEIVGVGYFTAIIKNQRMDFHLPHKPKFFYKENRNAEYLQFLQPADSKEPTRKDLSPY